MLLTPSWLQTYICQNSCLWSYLTIFIVMKLEVNWVTTHWGEGTLDAVTSGTIPGLRHNLILLMVLRNVPQYPRYPGYQLLETLSTIVSHSSCCLKEQKVAPWFFFLEYSHLSEAAWELSNNHQLDESGIGDMPEKVHIWIFINCQNIEEPTKLGLVD